MEAIGGYFSLELPQCEEFHKDALRLNTGRNCLEYILKTRGYSKVYIPLYTCEVLLEPFRKLKVPYDFYHIGRNLEITQEILLKEGEALLYTNFFGLKQRYVEQLAAKYFKQLIVDNTQAFYASPIAGIDTFYTCRKFFGVPDGAYLYTDSRLDQELEQDYSFDRFTHLLKRIDVGAEEGYADFRKVDDGLDYQPIRKMSKLTQRMMCSADYQKAASIRRDNYSLLQQYLGCTNKLLLQMDQESVPMVYPYLSDDKTLKGRLQKQKVFVPTYWPNVLEWSEPDDLEYDIANNGVFIPVDQRYGLEHMNRIIEIIKN